MLYLSGLTLCRLMRRHHVTIRLVAQRPKSPVQACRAMRSATSHGYEALYKSRPAVRMRE
jgi:hypothetical protein